MSTEIKKNEKPIRMIAIKQYKNFLAKPEGKINLRLVTRIVPKKRQKSNINIFLYILTPSYVLNYLKR